MNTETVSTKVVTRRMSEAFGEQITTRGIQFYIDHNFLAPGERPPGPGKKYRQFPVDKLKKLLVEIRAGQVPLPPWMARSEGNGALPAAVENKATPIEPKVDDEDMDAADTLVVEEAEKAGKHPLKLSGMANTVLFGVERYLAGLDCEVTVIIHH